MSIFEFLNSDLWLKYTQQRYLTPDEIRFRIQEQGQREPKWKLIESKILELRRTGAIPLKIDAINISFWLYPSDVLHKKIARIETLGIKLVELIHKQASFKQDFLLDSRIEESITSAIYEGAHSTRAQAEQLIASGKRPKNKDEWMLLNNLHAMNWVKEQTDREIKTDHLLKIHHIVTAHTFSGDDTAFQGKFRNDKVYVGPHEGVAHGLIENSLNQAIQVSLHNKRYLQPLVRAILLHYFTGYIHPFFDGNGRTARTFFYLGAMQSGLQYVELLSVSSYLKEHGSKYEKAFQKVTDNGYDITYFIDFCLDSILSALDEVSRKVGYLLSLNEVGSHFELTPNQVGLLQRMALHKFRLIDIDQYSYQIGKSREHARKELKRLVSQGLLIEEKVSKKFVYTVNAKKLKELTKKSAAGEISF